MQDSKNAFIAEMNAKAKLIGMVGTGFMNPHGLEAVGHVTTARDILMMGIHAVSFNNIVSVMKEPDILKWINDHRKD